MPIMCASKTTSKTFQGFRGEERLGTIRSYSFRSMRDEWIVDQRRQEIFHDLNRSRYCYIYLLKTKDEAFHYFKIFKAEVENQIERKIKRLRDDRGGEYISNEFSQFCAEHGIIHEVTPPYSPQSNGWLKEKIGHLQTW